MKFTQIFLTIILSAIVAFGVCYSYCNYFNSHKEEFVKVGSSLADAKDVEDLIKNFIINNPKLIIESVEKMHSISIQEEQARVNEAISKNITQVHKNMDIPRYGKRDAKVKIVEFFDYRCGYCKRMMSAKDKAIEKGLDVEFIFIEFPILGEASIKAAKAALAVNLIDSNKYIGFHRAMLAHGGNVDDATIKTIVGKMGIQEKDFEAALKNPKVEEMLAANRELAHKIGIQGSPVYIIGETYFPGAMSYEELSKMVEKASK